jgi:hypothetical protein
LADLGVEASYAIKHVDDDRGFGGGTQRELSQTAVALLRLTHGKRQSNKGLNFEPVWLKLELRYKKC